MPIFTEKLPLSLYIHLPWCVRKCPYCDFNSHEAKDSLPEELYIAALMRDLDNQLELVNDRPLISIFFGGGTPSLFSAKSIAQILEGVAKRVRFHVEIEITLEANPGTTDQARFKGFRNAGVNRLSLGLQSLQDEKLKALGRIHDSDQAKRAITHAMDAGFQNFNLDLMYGLPNQTIDDALHDLEAAMQFNPLHLSWYQLTIEPNTVFYKFTPTLPHDDLIWEMQCAGQALIKQSGLNQYEVSAYSQPNQACKHNRNYWEFGDYVGIGAGAHSKMTDHLTGTVYRYSQTKQPRDYLAIKSLDNRSVLTEDDLVFEFMLNALRLTDGVASNLFTERTGLPMERLTLKLLEAKKRGLLMDDHQMLCPTESGKRFLNNLVMLFLN